MAEYNQNVKLHRGDSKLLDIDVTMTGTLEGRTIAWWCARVPTTPTESRFISKSLSDGIAVSGDHRFTVTIDASDTANLPVGKWHHRAVVSDSDGKVNTVMEGSFEVLA